MSIINKIESYYYLVDSLENRHQEQELANELSNYLVGEYKDLFRYSKSVVDKFTALDKIATYSRNKRDADFLSELAYIDLNPDVRARARESYEYLSKKFLHYRK
ncbi:MAG: hypothetical protein INQ03_21480 [Candidatus Heimdallarchaeota archaeon]|nr:hypothetical protein [Candidatus Heimdallarchaeota archaeon]